MNWLYFVNYIMDFDVPSISNQASGFSLNNEEINQVVDPNVVDLGQLQVTDRQNGLEEDLAAAFQNLKQGEAVSRADNVQRNPLPPTNQDFSEDNAEQNMIQRYDEEQTLPQILVTGLTWNIYISPFLLKWKFQKLTQMLLSF